MPYRLYRLVRSRLCVGEWQATSQYTHKTTRLERCGASENSCYKWLAQRLSCSHKPPIAIIVTPALCSLPLPLASAISTVFGISTLNPTQLRLNQLLLHPSVVRHLLERLRLASALLFLIPSLSPSLATLDQPRFCRCALRCLCPHRYQFISQYHHCKVLYPINLSVSPYFRPSSRRDNSSRWLIPPLTSAPSFSCSRVRSSSERALHLWWWWWQLRSNVNYSQIPRDLPMRLLLSPSLASLALLPLCPRRLMVLLRRITHIPLKSHRLLTSPHLLRPTLTLSLLRAAISI